MKKQINIILVLIILSVISCTTKTHSQEEITYNTEVVADDGDAQALRNFYDLHGVKVDGVVTWTPIWVEERISKTLDDSVLVKRWRSMVDESFDSTKNQLLKRDAQADSIYQKILETKLADAESIIEYINNSGVKDEVVKLLAEEIKDQIQVPLWVWTLILTMFLIAFVSCLKLINFKKLTY